MHILDDPSELSVRACAFLRREAERAAVTYLPSECLPVPDRQGKYVSVPFELALRREGFARKFGGLRYQVRRVVLLPDGPHLDQRWWIYDLDGYTQQYRRGWSFGWHGEHVSAPVRYLQHTDGRFGVTDSGEFIPVFPTMAHLIESHALMDACAEWEPQRGGVIDTDRLCDDLPLIIEASGPWASWHMNAHCAVRRSLSWTSEGPRTLGHWIWTASPEGRRLVASVTRGNDEP